MSAKRPTYRRPEITTETDEQTLAVIRAYIDEHGIPPTIRDIGNGLGLTAPSTTQRRVQQLIDRGWITTGGDKVPRSIRIVRTDTKTDEVQL